MATIRDVSEWFLNKEPMTHKKLQKLCYYAQAWSYTLKDIPMIEDDTFQAWVHGPVSPKLYDIHKGNRWLDLHPSIQSPLISEKEEELLNSVWQTYGNLTGNALEVLSHSELPWMAARIGLEDDASCNREISIEDMKRYYSSIYTGGEE